MKRKEDFMDYLHRQVEFKRSLGKIRTATAYNDLWKRLHQFTDGGGLPFGDITSDKMQQFEAWLQARGNRPNTTSYYVRAMRTVYNKAVEEGIAQQPKVNPFKKVFTGNEKTVKRAIPVAKVREIAHMDFRELPGLPRAEREAMEYARDMFMFSFYTRGMSPIDIAKLRKDSLRDGVLTYYRSKTRQRLSVKWEKCMEEIRRRHSAPDGSPYMLDFSSGEGEEFHRIYLNRICRVNAALHRIGELAGCGGILTMYVARHSWASACKNSNIPLSVISEGMGHTDEETTRIYLAQLDTSIVDKANTKIIRQIL